MARCNCWRALALLFALGLAPVAAPLAAEPLPQPEGRVLLTVSGEIGVTNGDGAARFDRAMLEELGLHTIRTETPWTDDVSTFEGVRGIDVLERVEAQGATLRAHALNDYSVDIPVSDFRKYPVLLAMRLDGETMSVRDKGPLWVMYPFDQHEALRREDILTRCIWQLDRITVGK